MSHPCIVCCRKIDGARLCTPCLRSFDRAIAKSNTDIQIIEWAAKRAVRFERIRLGIGMRR